MERSITGKKAKWYKKFWWNHRDDLNTIGVKVAENERYIEYAVHYMIDKGKKDKKSTLTDEQKEEGDKLIEQRENELKNINLFK